MTIEKSEWNPMTLTPTKRYAPKLLYRYHWPKALPSFTSRTPSSIILWRKWMQTSGSSMMSLGIQQTSNSVMRMYNPIWSIDADRWDDLVQYGFRFPKKLLCKIYIRQRTNTVLHTDYCQGNFLLGVWTPKATFWHICLSNNSSNIHWILDYDLVV